MRRIKKIALPRNYGRHSKVIVKALKRGWWQVVMPCAAISGLAFLSAHSIAQYSASPVPSPAAVSRPEVTEIPAPPFRHPSVRLSPVTATPEHTVVPGDTLSGLAKSHCGSSSKDTALAQGNHLSLTSVLPLGKVLAITC